jgi:DNA-binding NtrC family response regulator
MRQRQSTLLCWHAERAGISVLENAIKALRNRHMEIDRVLYLVQSGRQSGIYVELERTVIEHIEIPLADPTQHATIYEQVRKLVLPRLRDIDGDLHINVSPGTPAMHSVWLILHAGGALPAGARLWSSQFSHETGRARIDPVDFSVTTYLAEIRRNARVEPDLAMYEPTARSSARRTALEHLGRYASVIGAPLLILGERGTGKTRLVEKFVAPFKGRKKIITVPCGGLDSALAESALFGHCKGAFTGATTDRPGLLAEAHEGILFLDEVQDLPKTAQRMLVRVFQDRLRRYRPVGSDSERSVDVELVCASNLSVAALRERLDADLFDRLSHLAVTIPPLRDCREDIHEDWGRVWQELRQQQNLPVNAQWSNEIERALQHHELPGNLRDLQRLAVLCMAWWPSLDPQVALCSALNEWQRFTSAEEPETDGVGAGSRTERIHWFRRRLAQWAKGKYGTWAAAAKFLDCDEKTLRKDAEVTPGPDQESPD